MKSTYDAIIIGAGAGGMVTAIRSAQRGKKVLIIEKCDRVGKKLLATGNGHCNMGNIGKIEGKYNSDFPVPILKKYNENYQREFFESIGLFTKVVDGRVFPYSMQASTVNNVLRSNLEKYGVTVKLNEEVKNIVKKDGLFYVNGDNLAKKVVLATGGSAMTLSDGNALLKPFCHKIKKSLPSLCPLITSTDNIKGLKGVRAQVGATLFVGGKKISSTEDEVIFKDNGLSGTAIFTLSGDYALSGGCDGEIVLDFMPEYSIEESRQIIEKVGLYGLFHKEIARNISLSSKGDLAYAVKNFKIKEVKLGSLELAQVTCGGLSTDDFDPTTLESLKTSGIYAIGEALDVNGPCGGYNLMWAFGSALLVGDNV